MQFWFVTVFPKYLKLATFSKDSLRIIKLGHYMKISVHMKLLDTKLLF